MTKTNNSNYYGNQAASDYHYKLGRKIYSSDVDNMEYFYKNNTLQFVAVMDYKHGLMERIPAKFAVNQVCDKLASDYGIPYFLCITYLDDNFDVPMYFLKPINAKALETFDKYKLRKTGYWFTPFFFSKFQHLIRGLLVADFAADKDAQTLSNTHKTYKLPDEIDTW